MIFAPMVVNILAYKINAVDNGAAVNMGPIQQLDFFVSYKRNQGVGEQNGDFSPYFLPFCLLVDADLSDSPAIKNSVI
ncbi:hypothetical protein [Peribacillus glennii]|uniref:Uncharacterized protein n=1 Tax=Peribacillus glennii TaxID=2303991 RepID=A0A372L6F9_9BACI|nr:hypothetical protein [Peribacillus glennii]RFU60590.1 hypothetical protein D0466_21315 [Peribacillus glennii]